MRAGSARLRAVVFHVVQKVFHGGAAQRMSGLTESRRMRFVMAAKTVAKVGGTAG